ncbi:MAG: helix-turn-helix domain-containing protein [Firmicutes bacterium]|nr:helix-turn-helix domain-containing protein [Bacillota bacterium]
MELEKVFAARLAEARKAQGLTKRALAARVGLSERAIGRFEQGHMLPSAENLVALAQALDCSVDWLLGLSNPGLSDHPASLTKGDSPS